MKLTTLSRRPKWLLPFFVLILAVGLVACNTPQPLPTAPTVIPTLPPATLPPPDTGAPAAPSVSLPVAAPVAAAGQTIYQAKCASCHGTDGNGVVEKARDFTDADYVRAAAPVAFFQAVTGGQGTMPAFKDELTAEERWNVVFFLWSFSVTPDVLAKGKGVYESAGCIACHGPDGQGAIPQARKFTPDYIAGIPATQFYQSVSAGKGIMPAHQDRLSADDRWAAVEYARAFAYEPLNK